MILYWDLDLNQLVTGPGSRQPITALTFRLGTNEPMQLRCSRAGKPDSLPTGVVLTFGIKPKGEYRADHLAKVTGSDWANPEEDDALKTYGSLLDLGGDDLTTLLSSDENGSTNIEADEIELMAEMSAKVPTETRPRATQTLRVEIFNNVNKGDEPPVPGAAGTSYPEPVEIPVNLAGVKTRTVVIGDPPEEALASVTTLGRSTGTLFSFTEASTGTLVFFRLVEGGATVGDTDQVTPADFDDETNIVHFALVPSGEVLGAPTGTGVIGLLLRTADGVTSWVTTSAFFRGQANLNKVQTAEAIVDGSAINPASIGATTPGTGRFTDLYPNFVFLGDGNITLNTDGSAGFAGLATFYGGISGDGSGLSGNAPELQVGAADYAVYAGGADTAVVAYGAGSSYGSDFDAFFHNSGYNSDISFLGGGCISLLYSDGHGVQMLPQASDSGLTLLNISDDTPAMLTLGDLNASGFMFAAGAEFSGVLYADTVGSGTSLYGPGGFSASSTGLTMDFGAITTDGGGSLDVGGTLHVEGSIYTSDSFFFADGSRLGVFDGQLVWTDADGAGHTLATE